MGVGRLVEYGINQIPTCLTAWSQLPKAAGCVTIGQRRDVYLSGSCRLPAVWSGSSFLVASCLSFPTCEPGVLITPYLQGYWKKDEWRAARTVHISCSNWCSGIFGDHHHFELKFAQPDSTPCTLRWKKGRESYTGEAGSVQTAVSRRRLM